jgi:hypothetical protein
MARKISAPVSARASRTSSKQKTILKSAKIPLKVTTKAQVTKPPAKKAAPKPIAKKVKGGAKKVVKAPAKPSKPAKNADPVKPQPAKKRSVTV